MKTRPHAPAQTPEDLLNDLRALVVEAEKMLSDTVTEHSQEALDSVRARFEAAQERLADLYSGARQKILAGARSTDTAIRENPYQSLAVALGVGVLVGVLIGRRSR